MAVINQVLAQKGLNSYATHSYDEQSTEAAHVSFLATMK